MRFIFYNRINNTSHFLTKSFMIMKTIIVLSLLFVGHLNVAAQNAGNPKIIEKHLSAKCSSPRNQHPITHLVLHFCSDAVQNPQNPHNVERIIEIFEQYKVSAHYLIDRQGNIYEFVPESRMAHHAGKGTMPFAPHYVNSLNIRAIGIEMLAVGSENDMKKFMIPSHYRKIDQKDIGFTESQYSSLKKLVDDILKRNPKIERNRKHIIGHQEYAPARRSDPGELFDWSKIGLQN